MKFEGSEKPNSKEISPISLEENMSACLVSSNNLSEIKWLHGFPK
jgi:hypothetical protein